MTRLPACKTNSSTQVNCGHPSCAETCSGGLSWFVCETCWYPSRLPTACDNPGCEANPSVSQSQKDAWKADRDRLAAEEAERERVRRIRRRTL